MKKIILAKSNNKRQNIKKETLIEHTEDLLQIFDIIISKISFNTINQKVSNTVQIEFGKLLKIICLLHDLGKMNIEFQKKIEIANKIDELRSACDESKELDELWKAYKSIKDARHNLLTGAFLKKIFEKLNIDEILRAILYKAILLHHGSYEQYLEISNGKIEKAVLTDIEQGIFLSDKYNYKEVEEFIKNELNIEIVFNEDFLDYEFMYQLNEDFKNNRDLQYLYIVLKGFLNLIDHLASTQLKDINYFLPLDEVEVDKKLIENIKKKTNKSDIKFRPMQEKLRENMGKNVLTEAFTGSGKTVADYRWTGKRKIFLVPNKISAESFYNDAEEILGVDNIGILHGDISLYVEDENSKVNSEGVTITLRDKILSRNFAKPYIIATVDQILLSMFKYPGYEKVFASIYDSYITVDEIHLLHPRMFLILIYFIEFANKYLNTKFHLMTATLPQAYKDKINKCNIDFIESNRNEQVEENRKIQLEIIKNSEKNLIDVVDKALKENNKVLIVRNTVDRAIEIFDFLNEYYKEQKEIYLLHSRFKFEDKKQKYQDILKQKGDIWISTQSVEISLDLDFQVVISDNAPIESIIQRMGRCNRHDTLDYGRFYIINEAEKDVYPEILKKSALKLLKQSNKTIMSMKDRKELLQRYYDLKDIKKYYEDEFGIAEICIKNIFGLNTAELNGENIMFNYEPYLNIVDNKKEASKLFRDTNINAKIILEEDFEKLQIENAKFKEYQFKSIQISEGYYRKLKKYNALYIDEGNTIVSKGYCTYDNEKGLQIKDKKSIEDKIIENMFI
ncbi:putative CRISPR-associated nuclease/helicase Cas3 [Clostridium tepidiprofundi DSM 19306]|uniref:Putative CRISPR-associated nuclease/helicase Cas3 n=1 Tax=Clostridium tepidiprofundi DSM 19306 TaxID=1121338 RepID=A0A151B2F5_9CLOT|nr:CRISPR-associated helicase/endonuclease Cas3 [Clostridium tepidiprofundi]KYH34078.1 putative CRISPR-associated nuclease/helicase Cas3 [Clostridium tepidiprofundi DSM 19306]